MAKKSEIDLLLVRSGRTEWEEVGRLQGSTDLPLSDPGRSVVRASVNHITLTQPDISLSMIACAPDEASTETARMLAERCGGKTKVCPGLGAFRLGLWEGMLDEELDERFSKSYRQWRQDPSSVNPPEGETFFAAEARLLAALLKALEKQGGKCVGVVVRPLEYGVLRSVMHRLPTGDVHRLIEDGPLHERRSLELSVFRAALDDLKASA